MKKKEEIIDKGLELPVDYGLAVRYEGNNNIVFYNEGLEYPIGGMICELARMQPTRIKDAIMLYPGYKEKVTLESLCSSFVWLEEKFIELFGPVAEKIITSEFMELTKDFMNNIDNPEYIENFNNDEKSKSGINEFIYKDTDFNCAGNENVGHVLLSVYTQQALSFVIFSICL